MNWYSLIMWRKSEKKEASFEEIAKRAYDTLISFNQLSEICRPNFLKAKKKKDVERIDWDYESFSLALKNSINREAHTGKVFEDLGYRMGFFSSLKNDQSFDYSIGVGIKNKSFSNTLIVHSPILYNAIDEHDSDVIAKLFERTIKVFEPYWGCVINDAIEKMERTEIDVNTRATREVHWLTYWSDEYAKIIGTEKLNNISQDFPKAKYHNGILKLQELMMDVSSEEDILYLQSVRQYLFGGNS